MSDPAAVDAYFAAELHPPDPALDALLAANAQAGLPAHDVAPNQGRLLMLLAQLSGARRVLEVGTLGGHSTLLLARALPPDGRVVSLERSPEFAAVARRNLEAAGVSGRVELLVGPAAETLTTLHGTFDLVFLDADKESNPRYLELVVPLMRPGALLLADNVVRAGAVADPGDPDPRVQGVRRFTAMVGACPQLEATAIQTVGAKGHDGFLIARMAA